MKTKKYVENTAPTTADPRLNPDVLVKVTKEFTFMPKEIMNVELGTATALTAYKTILVRFTKLGSDTGATKLYVAVTNEKLGRTFTRAIPLDGFTMSTALTVKNEDLEIYGGNPLSFHAYTDKKSAFASSCEVEGYTYDFAGN